MAMSALMNGADCGPDNALQQLLKHHDSQSSSLRNDGFAQQAGPSSLRTRQGNAPADADAQRFFARNPGAAGPSSFEMEMAAAAQHQHEAEDMARMERLFAQHRVGPSTAGPAMGPATQDWRSAFNAEQQQRAPSPSMAAAPQAQAAQSYRRTQMPFYGGGGSGMMYRSNMGYETPYEGKGKAREGSSRFVELDDATWEAEFARHATDKTEDAATAKAPEAFEDLDEQARKAMEQALDDNDDDLAKELDATWRNLRSQLDMDREHEQGLDEMAQWESEFGVQRGDEFDDGTEIPEPFDPRELDQPARPFGHSSDSVLAPYLELQDPFSEGQRLLAEGAPLREAALAFEAAAKQNPQRGEAWLALGDTLAADEKEMRAIEALEIAARCQGNGLEDAWLSLAISYVNEGQEQRSLATLERWLTLTYPDIVANAKPTPSQVAQTDPWANSRRVIDMFVAAARAGSSTRVNGQKQFTSAVDPDVQVGLGVLFYTNSDYTHARDCFEAALASRPDDVLLWNRLGATLANGGNPELAIDAYRKALELRSTFTRAIYNLGVSCLNIGCYHEAAEHLLSALELHRSGRGSGTDSDGTDGSSSLWYTLRRAFLCMDRTDLADMAKPGADIDQFRALGFDWSV